MGSNAWYTPSGAGAQAAARSKHTGGVNVARVDGSVQFESELIDLAIWRGMGTMAGGEPLPTSN
jgi:prepilin-type processing-associated H-X9-DG protein